MGFELGRSWLLRSFSLICLLSCLIDESRGSPSSNMLPAIVDAKKIRSSDRRLDSSEVEKELTEAEVEDMAKKEAGAKEKAEEAKKKLAAAKAKEKAAQQLSKEEHQKKAAEEKAEKKEKADSEKAKAAEARKERQTKVKEEKEKAAEERKKEQSEKQADKAEALEKKKKLITEAKAKGQAERDRIKKKIAEEKEKRERIQNEHAKALEKTKKEIAEEKAEKKEQEDAEALKLNKKKEAEEKVTREDQQEKAAVEKKKERSEKAEATEKFKKKESEGKLKKIGDSAEEKKKKERDEKEAKEAKAKHLEEKREDLEKKKELITKKKVETAKQKVKYEKTAKEAKETKEAELKAAHKKESEKKEDLADARKESIAKKAAAKEVASDEKEKAQKEKEEAQGKKESTKKKDEADLKGKRKHVLEKKKKLAKTTTSTPKTTATTTTSTTTSLAWSYKDPSTWDKALGTEVSKCSAEGSQSPIDILSTHAVYKNAMGSFKLRETAICKTAYFETTKRNWAVKFADVQSCYDELGITWNGTRYNLRSFTFHSPSEHKVDGTHFDMEAQFLHEDIDGNLLIVALFFRIGKKNPFMEHIVRLFPADVGEKWIEAKKDVSPYKVLFPADLSYWAYSGSLTTPPCTQNVQWIALKNEVPIHPEELNAYRASLSALEDNGLADCKEPPFGTELGFNTDQGVNNRPMQSLNDRVVYEYPEPGFEPKVQAEVMYDIGGHKVADPSARWSSHALQLSAALCCFAIFVAIALGVFQYLKPLGNGYGRLRSAVLRGHTQMSELAVFPLQEDLNIPE